MSGNCELGRGLLRREKNATEGGAGRFEKPAPDARAAPPEAHESLISRKKGAEVPLTGLSSTNAANGVEPSLANAGPLVFIRNAVKRLSEVPVGGVNEGGWHGFQVVVVLVL